MTKHLKRALNQIKRNKDLTLIRSSLNLHFKEQNKVDHNVKVRKLYDDRMSITRDITYAEYLEDKWVIKDTNNDKIFERVLKDGTLYKNQYDALEEKPQIRVHNEKYEDFCDTIEFEEINKEELTSKYLKDNNIIKERILADYKHEIDKLIKEIPEYETKTWGRQEDEARKYLADNTADTPFIDKLSEVRGMPKNILVDKIILKADAYTLAIATATGKKQRLEDELYS